MQILASILAIFVYGMIAATLGTILPDLSSRLGLAPRQSGMIALAQAVGLMIASLLIGPLMDKQGEKLGLLVGLVLAVAALLALPRSRSFAAVAVFLFILGLGGGSIVTGGNALASGVSGAYRATTLNLVNLFFGLGGLVTPFISANLLSRNLARLCYVIAGIAALAVGISIVTPMPGPNGASSFTLAQVGPVLGRPMLFLLALLLFLYVACEVGIWNWLAQHLIAQGIDESRALNILSLGFAFGLLAGRVVVSRVLLSVPDLTVLLACSIGMSFTTYLSLRAKRVATAGISVFLAGLVMAPVFPTTLAVVSSAFPRMASTALGIVIASGWLGLAVSSRIIGAIAGGDAKRLRKALMIIPAFSVLMILVNIAVRFIR